MEIFSDIQTWQTINASLPHLNMLGITLDKDFDIRAVNAYFLRKTSWTPEELIGKNFLIF